MNTRFDKLLVLDLDETLIHTPHEPLAWDHHFEIGPFQVHRRPGVEEFLAGCFRLFREVAIWTAATESYAIPVLEQLLDPKDLAFIWDRKRCTYRIDPDSRTEGYLKDLKKLRRIGYQKSKVLFVDDTPTNFIRSYGNLIHVRPFWGDPSDDELPVLGQYLAHIGAVPNVRAVDKRNWRKRISSASP